MPPQVNVVVEGISDEVVALRLLSHVGAMPGTVYITSGKVKLDKNIAGYNAAAQYGAWLVLRDLDRDAACPRELVDRLLRARSPNMLLRVPVRTIEAWLLADRERIAAFLGVSQVRVPREPDLEPRPKTALVQLASRSNKRYIKEDMVPEDGTSASVGPGYTARLAEFVGGLWRPDVACNASPSLARTLRRIREWRVNGERVCAGQ